VGALDGGVGPPHRIRGVSDRVVPKLAIPVRLSGTKLATVEQDTQDEVAQCVYAVAATELGTRVERRDFGVTSPLFRQGGADLAEIQAAVERWEPRASIETKQDLVEAMDTIRIEVAG
jgi:phage baseplate assembly protein W